MVLEHSSGHVFLPPTSTAAHDDTREPETLSESAMDVDHHHHLVDEGYSTQMEVDSHLVEEDSEDGGARLELEGQHGSSASGEEPSGSLAPLPGSLPGPPPSSPGEISPTDTSSLLADIPGTSMSLVPLNTTFHGIDDISPFVDLADADDEQQVLHSLDLNVGVALEDQPIVFGTISDENDPFTTTTDIGMDDSDSQSAIVDEPGVPEPPPPVALPPTPPTPQAVNLQHSYFYDPWDHHILVPDRGHIPTVTGFLALWKSFGQDFHVDDRIQPRASLLPGNVRNPFVRVKDAEECDGDVQGIDWKSCDTTRPKVRSARRRLYCLQEKFNNKCDICKTDMGRHLPACQTFFRFRQLSTTHIPIVTHWQLRNLITSMGQNDIFYATKSKIMHTHADSSEATCVADLTNSVTSSAHGAGFITTTLTSGDGFLVAGGFYGEYSLIDLTAERGTRSYRGRLSSDVNGITNHVHLFESRSNGRTQALFASNDKKIRILDCHTNRISQVFPSDVVNCVATSSDGRLRVQVGDFAGSMVVDSQTGRLLKHLDGNNGDSFACAWADDNVHVAVAGQDSHVLVFDARSWSKPVADIACELGCVRSLLFSPVGGGRRVLAAAEASDFVQIIDAATFDSKQNIDFFGNTAGVCFSPDGSELLIGNADNRFGGIFSYRRADRLGEVQRRGPGRDGALADWLELEEQEYDPRVRIPPMQRLLATYGDGMYS